MPNPREIELDRHRLLGKISKNVELIIIEIDIIKEKLNELEKSKEVKKVSKGTNGSNKG